MAKSVKKESPNKLNMSFEDALKKALNTSLPKSSAHPLKKGKKDKKK